MKGSLIVVGFFALGCILGWSGYLPEVVVKNDITMYVLYLLMFQVGLSIGSDKKLKDILCSIRPKLLLVPLATIIGTLTASALVSLLITKWSVFDCLAVGSGFAYYSLSSILITELKEASLGVQMATELGTIALIANIIREIMALLGAPLLSSISDDWLLSVPVVPRRWIQHYRLLRVIQERIWYSFLSFTAFWSILRYRSLSLFSVQYKNAVD